MHAALNLHTGSWTGRNTLHNPNTGKPETTTSTLDIEPVLGDRFVRLRYDWSCDGVPQQGELLVGEKEGRATASWVDTWHQGREVLPLTGTVANGAITLHGTFPAPPGPDWGWEIALTPHRDQLTMVMTCITPDGERAPAVDASWTRTPAT